MLVKKYFHNVIIQTNTILVSYSYKVLLVLNTNISFVGACGH